MKSATLEDIQHLCEEVRTIVDAGLPLEGHLADAAAGQGRRLEQLAETISEDLRSGRSLADSLQSGQLGAPRMLSAAVAAGIRSGRLSDAVEMLGDTARDLIELRNRILQAVTYPVSVLVVALGLFCVFIRQFLLRVRALFDDPDVLPSDLFAWLTDLDAKYFWWPATVPVLVLLFAVIWFLSGRAQSLTFHGAERLLFLLPGVRGLIRDLQFYNLTRMLALLVDQQMPLPEALMLAGAATGSPEIDATCSRAARAVEAGNLEGPPRNHQWQPGELPPMLLACLHQPEVIGAGLTANDSGSRSGQAAERLSSIAGFYRRRLDLSLLWMKNVVPAAMFVLLGGGTVVLYSVSVFWPIAEVYRALSPP
ncbi:MAG: type II secretion system F family protein [Planctomycetaceae bacterium]